MIGDRAALSHGPNGTVAAAAIHGDESRRDPASG